MNFMHSLDEQVETIISKINQIPQIQQKSAPWYEMKKLLITATEIATIMNHNPFQTAEELYKNKCHPEKVNLQASESTKWGEIYEPIAKQALQLRNAFIVKMIDLGLGICPLPLFNYLGASPDGLLIINDNGHLRLWLIEIKCLHKREITEQLPYNYWLQIQTQLYVWKLLFKQCNLELEGCIYCENRFEEIDENEYQQLLNNSNNCLYIGSNEQQYCKLVRYWEKKVIFDEEFYLKKVLPEIRVFKQFIDNYKSKQMQIIDSHETQFLKETKKRKREIDIGHNSVNHKKTKFAVDEIYVNYLTDNNLCTQKRYRHFVNQDPLLDWLDCYGSDRNLPKDLPNQCDLKSFMFNQYLILLERIYKYIREKANDRDCVQIRQEYPECNNFELKIDNNSKGISRQDLEATIKSMSNNVPVILNAVLYNPNEHKSGCFNVMIKYNYLSKIFPMAMRKLKESKLPYDPDSYTFIQIKYSKLKLCAANLYLLNQSNQKTYKLEQAHLHQVLKYYQINNNVLSFIMGRKSSYSTKGMTYENYNALNSFGLVDLSKRDIESLEDLRVANQWLDKVKNEGHLWSIDPPDRKQLYPNMKNAQDYPWNGYKQQLADKNKDLTKLWYVGAVERYRLWDSGINVTKWDQLNANDVKYNSHYKNIISNIISSNKSGQCINFDKLKSQLYLMRKPIQFYLDFEFVNDIADDFSQFPMSNSSKYIYMTGCLCADTERSSTQYTNYLVNRLNKNQEMSTLKAWLEDINKLNRNHREITIYHWGAAEKIQMRDYLSAHHQLHSTGFSENLICKINLIDLCEMFKNCEVGIPGCFGYGLKEIATVFYKNGWIKTIWPQTLSGEDALIAAILTEKECQLGKYSKLADVPLMKDYIQYNYVDCKVMEEIVNYIMNV